MCASHWAFTKPTGEMKVKAAFRSLRCDPVSSQEPGRNTGPSYPHCR